MLGREYLIVGTRHVGCNTLSIGVLGVNGFAQIDTLGGKLFYILLTTSYIELYAQPPAHTLYLRTVKIYQVVVLLLIEVVDIIGIVFVKR